MARRVAESDEVASVARRWVPGTGTVTVERMTSGLVNETYRITRAGRDFSLRIGAAPAQELGLDRGWECRVLAAASAAGLAPVIECCEPEARIVVAQWAAGRSMTSRESASATGLQRMAALLRRVHTLSIPSRPRVMSPAAWVELYSSGLRGTVDSPAESSHRCVPAAAVQAHLGTLAAQGAATPTLCHSDLHRLNVVVDDAALLLDWEYAHVSEPFWDLAAWTANNDLTETSARAFLAAYLGRAASAEDWSRFACLVWLYDYVCVLWIELYLNRRLGEPHGAMRGRLALLIERLLAPGR